MAWTAKRCLATLLAVLVLAQAGCATKLSDARSTPPSQARPCEDSEVVTSTHMAVIPVPIVAFFTPRITFNAPDAGRVLAACGGKQQVNRRVEANYAICVPTIFLTTLITLGIAGVCPTMVSWQADVVD